MGRRLCRRRRSPLKSDSLSPGQAGRLSHFGAVFFFRRIHVLWHPPAMGITPQQFEQMQNRLGGVRRPATPVFETSLRGPANHQVVLGIDPSLRGTGFGVIRLAKPHPQALAFGTIRCPGGWERSRCLVKIADTVRDLVRQHQPTVCVIEGLFYAQNRQTALIMGEARGASLVAVAEAGLEIYEVAPRKVKQAIVGYGAAQKLAVAKMVQRMLHLLEAPEPDAADALALALTQAREQAQYSLSKPKRI
jgi:crossover junction endodeoxyribonuclease RuvC